MKFVTPSQFADPDAAARKLVEIANATEAVQDGRIFIELINRPFLDHGGTPDQYRAALSRAIALGWLSRHESGTYVKFTPAGAERCSPDGNAHRPFDLPALRVPKINCGQCASYKRPSGAKLTRPQCKPLTSLQLIFP